MKLIGSYRSTCVLVRMAGILAVCILTCLGFIHIQAQQTTGTLSTDLRAKHVYDSLANIESEILLRDSRKWIEADTLPERAVAALTVVTNRYYQEPREPEEKKQVIEALQILGNLYMVRVIDYKKAYRSLWMARQIAEENEDYYNLAGIYSSLANLYSVNPGDKTRKAQKVEECLSLATEAAIKSGNSDLLRTITTSISVWSFPRKTWGNLQKSISEIRDKYSSDKSFAGPLEIATACDAYFSGNPDEAETHLLDARKKMDFRKFTERYRYSIDLILTDLYAETGKYDKALSVMRTDMDMAEKEGHTDFLLDIYEQMSLLFKKAGISDSTDYYYLKYNKLKSDFAERSSFGKVEEMDFLSEIDSINAEVERLSLKRQQQERRDIIILGAFLLTLTLLLALLWVHINLKRNHTRLYNRNREMLKREEEYKLLREQWELQSKAVEPNPESKESSHDDVSDMNQDSGEEEDMTNLRQTYARILMIFEESPEIYSLRFSLADLAKLVGKSLKEVSKAINVCHGGNFHQLLNKYRIRESVRLMHDPANNQLTIESIAEKSGFKSRTSFATLFKKMMGLTPSEYWRLARQQQEIETATLSDSGSSEIL